MNDKGIMTNGVIGNLRITTDLIAERDSLRRALEKACGQIYYMDRETCPLADADNFVKKEACEDCSDFMALCRAKDCWQKHFMEEKE